MNSFICIFKLFVGGGVFFRCVSGLCRDFLDDFFGLCRLMFGLLLELEGLTEEARSVLLDAASVACFSSFLSAVWRLGSENLEPRRFIEWNSLRTVRRKSSSEESEKFCIRNNSLDGLRAIFSPLLVLSLFLDPDDLSLS